MRVTEDDTMTWTDGALTRDARWDAWAKDHYGVEQWEQLDPQQLHELAHELVDYAL